MRLTEREKERERGRGQRGKLDGWRESHRRNETDGE